MIKKNTTMKHLTLVFLLFAALGLARAQENKLQLTDIYDLEYVSSPTISADGSKVLYVRNFKDIMTDKNLSNIWMGNFDGSDHLPVTTGNQSDNSPVWSPDKQRVIYRSNKDGSTQLYMRWLSTGAETKLTNLTESPGSPVWSPDGKYIAFTLFTPQPEPSPLKLPSKPEGAEWNPAPKYITKLDYRGDGYGYARDGSRQLYVMSTEGGTPRQLTFEKENISSPVWSPDSKHLYFSANLREDAEHEPQDTEIYRIPVTGGELTQLTDRFGPDRSPAISPDGKQMAYLSHEDVRLSWDRNRLYVMDLPNGEPELISEGFMHNISNIHWDEDGKTIYFQYNDHGKIKLAEMNMRGKVTDLTDQLSGLSLGRPYVSGTYSIAPNGNYAFTLGSTDHPADLGLGEGSSVRRITNLNEDLFSFRQLGEVEEIRYPSSHDDREIQGWVIKPPNFDPNKKYPLILEIHGGPFAMYGFNFTMEAQLYAASGYVVLYTNPRGSTGYGQEFVNLIDKDYPSQDYDDLMSGVDAVIDKGYIDEDNLFVTGGSGGGVLSSWIVGKTDRFKAAVVAKPVINWYTHVLYADAAASWSKHWHPGYPWNHQDYYMDHSPISLVGNVTTPTMLLTGELDLRTPMAESEQYYTALKLRKVPAALVRIPNAYHGIAASPSNLVSKVAAVLHWFDKYNGKPKPEIEAGDSMRD